MYCNRYCFLKRFDSPDKAINYYNDKRLINKKACVEAS